MRYIVCYLHSKQYEKMQKALNLPFEESNLVHHAFLQLWVSSVEFEMNHFAVFTRTNDHLDLFLKKISAQKNMNLSESMDIINEYQQGKFQSSSIWKEVTYIRKVRNLVVHTDGRINQKSDFTNVGFREYIDSFDLLYKEGQVRLNTLFCMRLMVVFNGLFSFLLRELLQIDIADSLFENESYKRLISIWKSTLVCIASATQAQHV